MKCSTLFTTELCARQWRWIPVGMFCLGLVGVAHAQVLLSDQEFVEFTPLGRPIQKFGQYTEGVDPTKIKWGRAAMFNPRISLQVMDKQKSPQQREAEELSRLALTNPEEYRRLNGPEGKIPKRRGERLPADELARRREAATRAFLHPTEVAAEREKGKTAAMRRREEIASEAILNPRRFNEQVERRKSADLRQKEADAILALSEPGKFLKARVERTKADSVSAGIGTNDVDNERTNRGNGSPQNDNLKEDSEKGGRQ